MKPCKTLVAVLFALALGTPVLMAQEEIKLSGAHYNLNLIGHAEARCPTNDFTVEGSNRHTIHVLLNFSDGDNDGVLFDTMSKKNKIFLTQGDDFQVIDGNACDSDGAEFMLPVNNFTCVDDPATEDIDETVNCEDSDFTTYQVFARPLGSPKNTPQATITTCAVDDRDTASTADDEVVCSTENVLLIREKGKSNWQNVTRELTSLCWDQDGDNVCDTRIALFDDALESYFWDLDNNGVRLIQLRFYMLPD